MRFIKKLLLIVSITLVFKSAFAQETQLKSLEIYSKITKDYHKLKIQLPEEYDETKEKSYPVLYVLDGQNWFSTAVSIHKVFTGAETNFKSMPDFIVVGITTNWKQRRDFFNSENAELFIKTEVVPFVDKKFKTTNERLLFGWQFAGGFVMNMLARNPNFF